jgi:hypothetical protein
VRLASRRHSLDGRVLIIRLAYSGESVWTRVKELAVASVLALPFSLPQIQTLSHAGGITSDLIRCKVALSRTGFGIRAYVREAPATTLAPYARPIAGYVAQSGGPGPFVASLKQLRRSQTLGMRPRPNVQSALPRSYTTGSGDHYWAFP